MKKVLLLTVAVMQLLFCQNSIAQNKQVRHKTDQISIRGYDIFFDIQNGSFDYYYYENPSGDYIKHGNFKIEGSRTYEDIVQRRKRITTDTYNATGKYVDGWLDGTLTITRRMKQDAELYEWKLTAGYKDGLPHGEWKLLSNSKTMFVCHFNEGQMVGAMEMNYANNKGHKSVKGSLDNEGMYDGKWHIDDIYGESHDYEFVHGVLCRYIKRGKDGSVINKSEQDLQNIEKIRELATQLSTKQISTKDLEGLGFEYIEKDDISADNIIEELFNSSVHYGLDKIGGQKTIQPNKQWLYHPPYYYLVLSIQPVLPEKHMNALLSYYHQFDDIISHPERHSYSEVEHAHTSLYLKYNDHTKIGDYRDIYYNTQKFAEGGLFLPGSKNTSIYGFGETYTFSKKQADAINDFVKAISEIYKYKKELSIQAGDISTEERRLEKLSKSISSQYYKNLRHFRPSQDLYDALDIKDRLGIIDNYFTFAGKSKYIKDTLCPQLRKKVENIPLKSELDIYINNIDYNIYDTTASSDIDRLDAVINDLRHYDILIGLQKQYLSLNTELLQIMSSNKNINNVYTNYIAKSELTNDISSENINRINRIVAEMQSMLDNLHSTDIKTLEKTIKSQKKDTEAQLRTLIGDLDYNQIISPLNENESENGEIDEALGAYEEACNEWIEMSETEREDGVDIILTQRRYLEDLPDFSRAQTERYESINNKLKAAGFPESE